MKTFLKTAGFLLCTVLAANAQYQINYSLAQNGSDFTYNYTVHNTGGPELTDFLIYFPALASPDAFSYVVTATTQPANWGGSIFPPSAIDLGGFVEFSTAFGGILTGSPLSGFSATFQYTGTSSAPHGSQEFEVYDSNFIVIGSGQTIPDGATGVPDQTNWVTFLLAAAGLAAFAGRRQPAS